MRASDQDRKRTVDELRRHCAAGRLDVDEYASRVERAMLAPTLEELDELRADLPMLRIAEPAGRQPSGAPRGSAALLHRAAAGGKDHDRRAGPDQSLLALGVAAISVLVVLAAIVVGLAAEWVWAVLLLAGWAAGLVQGRLGRHGRRDH